MSASAGCGQVHAERDAAGELVETTQCSGERDDFDLDPQPALGSHAERVGRVLAAAEPGERLVADDRAAFDVVDRLQCDGRVGHTPDHVEHRGFERCVKSVSQSGRRSLVEVARQGKDVVDHLETPPRCTSLRAMRILLLRC